MVEPGTPRPYALNPVLGKRDGTSSYRLDPSGLVQRRISAVCAPILDISCCCVLPAARLLLLAPAATVTMQLLLPLASSAAIAAVSWQ
jgi:hypothetical protein